MTVGESAFIGDQIHHNLVGDAAAQGHTGIRSQVFYKKRSPENPLGIDLDQIIFMEAQGEQAAADSFSTLDVRDPQLPAVRRFRQSNHFSSLISSNN
jgi:hypothetical protein